LAWAREQRWDGTLVIEEPSHQKLALSFESGGVVKAQVPVSVAPLGQLLVEASVIGQAELDAAAGAAQDHGTWLGEELVTQGLISTAQLSRAMREQLVRRVQWAAARAPESIFGLYAGVDYLESLPRIVGVKPFHLIWRCAETGTPIEHIERRLSAIPNDPIVLRDSVQQGGLTAFGFHGKAADAALVLLKHSPTRSELGTQSGMPPDEVARLLYALAITGRLAIGAARDAQSRIRVRGSVGPGATTSPSGPAPKGPSEADALLRAQLGRHLRPPSAPHHAPPSAASHAPATSHAPTSLAPRSLAPTRTPHHANSAAPGRNPSSAPMAHDSFEEAPLSSSSWDIPPSSTGAPRAEAGAERDSQAAALAHQAELCLRRNDYKAAERAANEALNLVPNRTLYRAISAFAHAHQDGGDSTEQLKMACKVISRAVSEVPNDTRLRAYRAYLYKRLDREDLAIREYKRILQLEPSNIDAAREIRLFERRGVGSGRSILGKLLGR
jgi:hypothetical protein